jgi:hypothetical protein
METLKYHKTDQYVIMKVMCTLHTHAGSYNSHILEGPALVEFCARSERIMYTQGNPTEIQIPAYWKLIRRSMIALPPVLSPSSILPPLLSRCVFIPARFENFASTFLLLYNCASLKLLKSGTVHWAFWYEYTRLQQKANGLFGQKHNAWHQYSKNTYAEHKKPDDEISFSHRPV